MVFTGFWLNGKCFSGFSRIHRHTGRSVADFILLDGYPLVLINMGVVGGFATRGAILPDRSDLGDDRSERCSEKGYVDITGKRLLLIEGVEVAPDDDREAKHPSDFIQSTMLIFSLLLIGYGFLFPYLPYIILLSQFIIVLLSFYIPCSKYYHKIHKRSMYPM